MGILPSGDPAKILILDLKMSLNRAQRDKKGPRHKWTIYKHESDQNNKCLSVGNFGILSVIRRLSVARLQPTPVYLEA